MATGSDGLRTGGGTRAPCVRAPPSRRALRVRRLRGALCEIPITDLLSLCTGASVVVAREPRPVLCWTVVGHRSGSRRTADAPRTGWPQDALHVDQEHDPTSCWSAL
eukprot:471381-Prymnesium_polylepis.2